MVRESSMMETTDGFFLFFPTLLRVDRVYVGDEEMAADCSASAHSRLSSPVGVIDSEV